MKDLICFFEEKRIKLWVEDGRLKFSGPKEEINRDFLNTLKENKEELLAHLSDKTVKKVLATKNQMALWLESQMGNNSGIIHNGFIKKLKGAIQVEAIRKSFLKVISRHDALRSVFCEENEKVYIKQINIDHTFFQHFTCCQDACLSFIQEEMNQAFKLDEGPLFRVSVYQCSDDECLIGMWMHHIISDAYSLMIIEKEFLLFYNEFVNQEKHHLSDVPSYMDSIIADHEYLKSEQFNEDLNFWRHHLNTRLSGTSLPKFKITTKETSYTASEYIDTYTKDLTDDISIYARKNQFTTNTLFLAAFNLALHWINESNINALGIFSSNRLNDIQLKQVGYFSNGIVFQHEVNEDESFVHYLKRIKESLARSFAYQNMPFTSLVEELRPVREGGMPYFNIVIDSLLFPEDLEKESLQKKLGIEDIKLVKGSANYDLIVWISKENSCYRLEYRYNNHLFDDYQILSLASIVREILTKMNPQILLKEIPLVNESQEGIVDKGEMNPDRIGMNTALELITEISHEQKEKIAINFQDQEVNYSQMRALAEKFSKVLKTIGIKKGDCVGIISDKNSHLISAVMGIWAVGAIYVPIDINLPVNRKEYIINHTKLSAIIQDGDDIFWNMDVIKTIILDEIVEMQDKDESESIISDYPIINKEDPAYILYTSGSTGNPKGVIINHGALFNLLCAMKEKILIKSIDKMLALSSICFDMSILEMFLPLTVGATVVMIPHATSKDGKGILNVILKKGITIMQGTPSSFKMLYDYFDLEGKKEKILDKCLCGGESYEIDLVDKMQEMSNEVYNAYGPTETTVWSTIYQIPKLCSKIKLGQPIANTQIVIADKHGRRLPLGTPGELLIGGVGVFDGYYNASELTQSAFIQLKNKRLYKTGDWVYQDKDGEFIFLGRRDNQIKIRGFRIEISEIENVYKKCKGVHNAAIAIIERNQTNILIAILVKNKSIKLDEQEMVDYIKKYVPEYMVPNRTIFVDQLPVNSNNKIDRKAIIEMATRHLEESDDVEIKFSNDLEREVKEKWESLLGYLVNSIDISFFEVGGDSLILNKLVIELQRELGKSIDIVDLLKYNTIRKMAAYINGEYEIIQQRSSKLENSTKRRSQLIKKRRM